MRKQHRNAGSWPVLALSTLTLALNLAYAADENAADEETIQIVGSRIAVRSETDTAAPVDIIRGDELRKQGFSDVGKALEALAPSYNFAEMTITDGSDHVKPAMLRGLGPDQTLVLINGKRRHNSALIHTFSIGKGTAGTDLNAIPMSAVNRIEILRDGASAQYGSDAIAGVINIVLKGDTDTTLSQQYSVTSKGDGDTLQTGINSGFNIGQGYLNLTGEYKKQDSLNRAKDDPHTGADHAGTWLMGEPELTQKELFYNFWLPLAGGSAELYSFGGYAQREGHAGGYFRCREILDDGTTPDDDGHPTNDTYCGTIPDLQRDVYPRGTLPLIDSDVEDTSFAAGVKFELAGWQSDISVVQGENSFGFDVSHSINYSYGLGPTGDASDVPTSAHSGDLIFGQRNITADFSKMFSDTTVAFGLAQRHETYEIKAGDCYSYANYSDPNNGCDTSGVGLWGQTGTRSGIQVFPGWRPQQEVDLARDSRAIYAEIVHEFTPDFRLEAAARQEHYDDFGNDFSTKLAMHWAINDVVSMRGSISDGFRAPSLQQVGYSQFISAFDQRPVTKGIFRVGSDVADAFSIPELDAEDSKSVTVGWVIKPADDLSITVDMYQIKIADRITISGEFARERDDDDNLIPCDTQTAEPLVACVLDANNLQDVSAVSFFTNAIDTKTTGVDLILHYRQDVEGGQIDYTLASSYNHTEVTAVDDAPGVLAGQGLGDIYFDRHERARTEKYSPRNRHTISAVHSAGNWRMGVAANYYGSITTVYDASDSAYDYRDRGRWIMDLSLGYDWGNGVTLNTAMNNVTDEYPLAQHQDWNGVTLPYSEETLQWGLAGRTYSAIVGVKF